MIAIARKVKAWATWLALSCFLSGCGLLPPTPQTDALLKPTAGAKASAKSWPHQYERSDLPIVLQDPDYCGPAALSMVLSQAGMQVSQDELGQKVFLPGRAGTLQTEMLAGPRHWGKVAYELNGQLPSLLDELRQGRSPVVLLNLGLSWAPRWHYAVIMGYDLDRAEIILRSGTQARQALPLRTFEYTWARSQYWSMVVAPPDVLPDSVDAVHAEQAALGFEQVGPAESTAIVWRRVAARWPDRLLPQLALGNAYLKAMQEAEAARVFEQATQQFDSAVAWNNLAQARLAMGDRQGALEAAQRGLARARAHEPRWIDAIMQTLQSLQSASAQPATSTCDPSSKRC